MIIVYRIAGYFRQSNICLYILIFDTHSPFENKILAKIYFPSEINGVEMFENCLVAKPRFMIVKWNHRVEEKLLYSGIHLSLTV